MIKNLEGFETTPLAVYGIPRSGFSLSISTLYKLGFFNHAQTNELETIDKDLGELIYSPITSEIKENLTEDITLSGEFSSLTGGPKQLKNGQLWVRKYIGLGKLGDITLSIKIPDIFACLCPLYHSHTVDDSIAKRKCNIFSLRHPCGIYESSINSFNALTSEYLQTLNKTDIEEENIRRQLALHKICSQPIRESMIKYLSDNMMTYSNYYEKFSENIQNLSWEGFLYNNSKNANNLIKVFNQFGIKKSILEIDQVIKESKYRNLLQFHKHNYRPGHAMLTGWVTELPLIIIKEIENLKSYRNYIELLDEGFPNCSMLNEGSLLNSKFSKLSNTILKLNSSFDTNIDPLLKEYALNKTNVDQSSFKNSHIVNHDCGLIYVHRMSKSCKNFIKSFEMFSDKLNDIFEKLGLNFRYTNLRGTYKNYPNLNEPIHIAKELKNTLVSLLN